MFVVHVRLVIQVVQGKGNHARNDNVDEKGLIRVGGPLRKLDKQCWYQTGESSSDSQRSFKCNLIVRDKHVTLPTADS